MQTLKKVRVTIFKTAEKNESKHDARFILIFNLELYVDIWPIASGKQNT